MKACLSTSVSLVLAAICGPLLAAPAAPTTLVAGSTANDVGNSGGFICVVSPGTTLFHRRAATRANPNPPAMIGAPEIRLIDKAGQTEFNFYGMAQLSFTSASAGQIRFDFDQASKRSALPSGESALFKSYTQVWEPADFTLRVSFDIVFKNCTLPIRALFHTG